MGKENNKNNSSTQVKPVKQGKVQKIVLNRNARSKTTPKQQSPMVIQNNSNQTSQTKAGKRNYNRKIEEKSEINRKTKNLEVVDSDQPTSTAINHEVDLTNEQHTHYFV